MIKTVTAAINGQTIFFNTNDSIHWYVSSLSPKIQGVYPITLSIKMKDGREFDISYDDSALTSYLKLYVSDYMKTDLISYIPDCLKEVSEFKAITSSEDTEFDILKPSVDSVFAESVIMYCSEKRLEEWEEALNIVPSGTLYQRKLFLKATLRGFGKLNQKKIQSVVNAFTGGTANVSFEDSTVIVKILPPNNGEVYQFPDVERSLKPLMPAHLKLSVLRYYSTWKDIKNNYASWQAVMESENWRSIRDYIAP